tara:strand:+ start:1948 stop:2526 length:579 start_codon:yes stop_codon:yes gene_type:complete
MNSTNNTPFETRESVSEKSSSSPPSTTHTTDTSIIATTQKEEEKGVGKDASGISKIRFRRQSSVHDIGPMELLSRKTTVLEVKEKLKEFFTEEEHVKNEETNKTSSITKNLTTDDIKLLYLGKVLDGCDDVTLFELGIPSAGVTTIMHTHVVPPNMRRRSAAQKFAGLTTKLMSSGDVDANANGQPSCCSIQ